MFFLFSAPTSEEIQSGQVQKRDINIDSVKNTAKNAGNEINGIINQAGQETGQELAKALLSAFDNFVPKKPTNGKAGCSHFHCFLWCLMS